MDKTFRIRLAIAYLGIALLGVAVISRAAYLMLVPSERLQAAADRQFRQDQPPRLPRRGQILDTNREPLAVSLDVKSLYANPSKIENKAYVAKQLAATLRLPLAQVSAKLKEKRGFVWIKRQLTDEELASIERWLGQNRLLSFSLGLATESKRFYPNQNLASTLLGFTNVDSQGIEGLEYQFDKQLGGEKTAKAIESDSVVLTIDKSLQNVVEQELEAGLANSGGKNGTSIVMDAATGDILAMASYPNYNPNNLKLSSSDNRRNRAVTDTFEPGSTMKAVLVSGAVEANAVNAGTKVFCEMGKLQIGKHWIREAEAKDKWGWLRVDEVIQKSSNVGATKIGFLFGAERLFNWYNRQGFSQKTGIDFPGEVSGYIPPLKGWAKIHLSNISFGQGLSVTPLQITRAYATIANGGWQPKPRLVREWRNFEGELVKEIPATKPVQVMKESTAKALQAMLAKVPTIDGTAIKAAVPGFVIAGKTGTAQKPISGLGYRSDKKIASFVGFALNVEPRYVVFVMVDEPKFPYFGGEVAAPIFRKVMMAALARAGVKSDPKLMPTPIESTPLRLGKVEKKKAAAPALISRAVLNVDDGLAMPNLMGASAREVMDAFDKRPVTLRLHGSGVVVEQIPAPGSKFKKGDSVSIRLDRASM